ncbi:Structural maintenance of chromosomes protein 1 [Tilletia horrida]|uniref:Structural maintenance of chromosomes protein n=1 Tax=Tilletia horrida TaxID=155126 RepID=A0AAN6K0L7_9BASI|nr:Structural maintenance of chromosomes protein 1 [Tilletia horrida]KAK0557068.1 Structural maintenance of chromosomes protein 1 [Tilletia horrida]
MPLLRLEVENFKSYRGRQTIGPFYSFTAVIGPNGSGKSNLMDAISFVLGVKSSHLRSNQLRDLIYRGRRLAREPADGQDAADAMDISDNEDDEEGEGTATKASVTAVYRDGRGIDHRFQRSISLTSGSEYRYNGRVVPHATYDAKLTSFNILVKAKNFLVFQGDVEAVASQQPKDLSRLIDQISGSLELKEEYEQARERQDRAIESSTAVFSKRRGINSELRQFKEQKSEAERFERLLIEKDELILHRLIWRLFHIEDAIGDNVESVDSMNAQLAPMRSADAKAERKTTELRQSVARLSKEIIQQEGTVRGKEKEMQNTRPELDALNELMKYSKGKSENATRVLEQIEKDLGKHQHELRRLKMVQAETQRRADVAAAKQKKLLESSGLKLGAEDLSEYNTLKAQAATQAVQERQQIEALRREARIRADAVQKYEDRINELLKKRARVEEEAKSGKEKLARLEAANVELTEKLKKQQERLGAVKREKSEINQRGTKLNEDLQVTYNKLLQANHDQRETEREAKLKETYASLQKIFPGVRGRVMDLCRPTQRKYDLAITTILGTYADALVVDTEKVAIDCITYMRDQRAGQATLLPLDTLQVKPINDRLRSIAKGARLAVDVVEFAPTIERAIHFVCGNSVVCDSLEVARHVRYEKEQQVKAVALDGSIIHKSGLMTGGQTEHTAARRWEEREVAGLHRQRDEALAELKELSRRKRSLTSEDEFVAAIAKLESQLAQAKEELNQLKSRMTGISEEITANDASKQANEPKLATSRERLAETTSQIDALEVVVNAAEDSVFNAFCARIGVENIREYEETQLKALQERSDEQVEYESQLARLAHQIKFEGEQVESIEERVATLKRTKDKEAEKLRKYEEDRTKLSTSMEGLEAELAESSSALEQLKAKHASKSSELEVAKKESKKAASELNQVLKEVAAANVEIEKLGTERLNIYRRCRLEEIELPLLKGSLKKVPLEEADKDLDDMDVDVDASTQEPVEVKDYGIEVDYSDLSEAEKDDGGPEMERSFRDRINNVDLEIEKLSPNMKAVERLGDTEAKLAKSEKEFERARREARDAREEFNLIKKKRCELFNKAYKHISERIDKVYKALTAGKAAPMGGVAYLSLEDDEEPYLSGVKYHAMPPMKRFRDMDQLSGGEKTMAALALLFAIHSYQPAPFFVLDEVDAALDSQNVAKVSNYIREHASDQVQFIVISLKASLYERAQALVGIYRDQDQNSSASLTLDLEQYDTVESADGPSSTQQGNTQDGAAGPSQALTAGGTSAAAASQALPLAVS